MPITAAAVPSLIGAGASIYGANKAASASKKAAEQALALQREQYQQARTDMQPYTQAGQAGANALQQRLLGGGAAAGPDPGTFGTTANPAYQTPTAYQAPAYETPQAFHYGAEDYTASPGYQWQLQQGMNAINSSQAHRGGMDSGATLKSLARYAQGLALQDFNAQRDYAAGRYDKDREFGRGAYVSDRDFGRGVYDTDANRARSIYENDRGYMTDRYDTQTQNLTGLAGMGLDATKGLVGAGSSYADGASGVLNNRGNTQSGVWAGAPKDAFANMTSAKALWPR